MSLRWPRDPGPIGAGLRLGLCCIATEFNVVANNAASAFRGNKIARRAWPFLLRCHGFFLPLALPAISLSFTVWRMESESGHAFFGIAEGAAIFFDAPLDRAQKFAFPFRKLDAAFFGRLARPAQRIQRRAFGLLRAGRSKRSFAVGKFVVFTSNASCACADRVRPLSPPAEYYRSRPGR